uniref:SRA1/Sec31 domain-containing protein n=1 Tax=Anopheles maculatus TaxID=74869 RepID=A0A182SHD3_9DIPT
MAPITSPLPAGLAPSNGYPDPNSNYMQGNTGQHQHQQQQQQPYMTPQSTMYNPTMGSGGPPSNAGPGLPPQSNTINYQNFQPTLPSAGYQQTGQGQVGGVYYQGQQPMDGGQQQQPMQPPAPEPPKQKPPLPEQYVFMQTVFEELKKQCVASAGNPQTKRKLEDVSKRLEMLYDLLRENRLSQNTLNSLNQLVALIQAGDYANGIGLHTQMV